MSADIILEVRGPLPQQEQDSPFELPSEQLLRQQAVTTRTDEPNPKNTDNHD